MKNSSLKKMAKQILPDETLVKVNSISDAEEAEKAIKYLLVSHLERMHHKIENKITDLESRGVHVFEAHNLSILLPSKIKHFQVDYSESEFEKILVLIRKIKAELKHVAV